MKQEQNKKKVRASEWGTSYHCQGSKVNIGRTCSTHGGKLKERSHFGELGTDGSIILKLIIDEHSEKM